MSSAEWAADRAIRDEGSPEAALALYRRLVDGILSRQDVDLQLLAAHCRVIQVLKSRINKKSPTSGPGGAEPEGSDRPTDCTWGGAP